uniref:Uncharacterized protein n=1 Tax=Panagrolaimus sp. ES5 TaxID=591445 RepID=A0AC34F1D8_9BILA
MLVGEKFQRKDKIVNVELQFEQAVFPAVTICNLNPFKHHLARKVPEISETLDAFHQAVSYSKDAAEHYDDASFDSNNAGGRYRRENENLGGFRYVQYEPVMSDCSCITGFKGEKENGKKQHALNAMILDTVIYQKLMAQQNYHVYAKKMILTMAGLPVHRRIALSYGKAEFIRMCNIINDFKLHVDPAFGNCYTFNANRENPLIPSRAGPSYGLRLMVYINASDYLPTTESQGVRIAIHGQAEWPFPDTFGYSAPTGSVSSFGLSMGCYKSCYQQRIIRRCGCADPRYPISDNETIPCDSLDPISRNCLLVEGIRFTKRNTCYCKHRCSHNVYSTTFSSAKLARGAFRNANCKNNKAGTCFDYDGTNAAMIEIYYEQMSYETLTERESYLFVNMISDIGGQAGLWLGASVITVFEILAFLTRVCAVYCRRKVSSPKHDPNDPSHHTTLSNNTSKGNDYGTHSTPRVVVVKRRPSSISNETHSEYSEDEDDTTATTKPPQTSESVIDRPLIEDGNHYEISA